MASVIVSPAARRDLIGIRDYISVELANPDAALRILKLLREGIESLRDMPERGKPLDAVLSAHTDYRFLVCENYRIPMKMVSLSKILCLIVPLRQHLLLRDIVQVGCWHGM